MPRVQQLNRNKHAAKKLQAFELNHYQDPVSVKEYKRSKNGPNPRLCGNLSESTRHANSILKQGSGGRGRGGLICIVCQMKTYTSCGICRIESKNNEGHPSLCFYPSKGAGAGNLCFMDYHNDVLLDSQRNIATPTRGRMGGAKSCKAGWACHLHGRAHSKH
jgi:hypothetical protein